MADGWSVGNKRIELKAGFPAGKLAVDGEALVKLKSKGEWPLSLDGRSYTFRRKAGLMGPTNELVAPDGQVVPLSSQHTPRKPALAGSVCGVHVSELAEIICARCGTFACAQCCSTDATHCAPCIAPMIETHKKHQANLILMAPGFVFMVSGGALGAMLGVGAGALAVAIARKLESWLAKWLVAIGLYAVAAIVFVVLVAMLRA